MKTYLECIPCFFKQALEAGALTGADKNQQKQIIDEVSKLIPNFSLAASPPEMGKEIHGLVERITGIKDPYKKIKINSNIMALKLYTKLKKEINDSRDSLLAAVKCSIAGNIIDYGAKNSFNVEKEINQLFQGNIMANYGDRPDTFNFDKFKKALNEINSIVYLADNAGEVVFDRLLIEELVQKFNKKVIYVVKDKPIINDALIEDAVFCGIDKSAHIISNGTNATGTLLEYCSDEFLNYYKRAELIISKGQANYESLSEVEKPIFFLLRAKCPVIAKEIGCNEGDIVLISR